MEGAGVGATIALGKLASKVRQTCDRCAKAPKSFDNLRRDLHAFCTVLEVAQPSFPPGRDPNSILGGCDKVICDIIELLSKHDSLGTTRKKVLDRFSWISFRAEIKELRSRLSIQVGMLGVYLM